MTFDEWIALDEGAVRFGLKLRPEWIDAARKGWEAGANAVIQANKIKPKPEPLWLKNHEGKYELHNLQEKEWKPLSSKTKLHLVKMSEKMSILDLIDAIEEELKWENSKTY